MKNEPIRKRGYHRALKRKESWALIRQAMGSMMRDVCEQIYKQQSEPSPLMKLVGLKKSLQD